MANLVPLADTPAPPEAATEDAPVEPPPSLGESWRTVWKIGVLRRIFIALPFLAAAIAGFASLASLQYQETFHLDAVERAYLIAPTEVFDILGLAVGAVIATRLAQRDVGLVFRMLAAASVIAAAFAVLFALAPNVPLAFVGNAGIVAALAVVGPGVLASLSIAIPPRVRAVGFSIGALFVLPGFLVLPVVGAVGDAVGFRYGLLILVPIFVIGGLIVSSAGGVIERDVQDVWNSMRTRTQMLIDRQAGRLPLLAVRELSVGYDGVVVLADVAIEIGEGEIVALVGTNGAGKSTLLRAIGGVVEADHGAIVFDGRDITHLPPDEIARLGVAQVPGGEGIFPNLRVEDNLRVAAWQGRRRGEHDADMIDEALSAFPTLASRRDERAANLSGGQQQMLALAMATITRPKLFLIDELSLGLSPIVVEQLLGAIESMRQAGTAILLVEQSMNVAVAVADRIYVMETGVVRFSGIGRRAGRPSRAALVRLPGEGLQILGVARPGHARRRQRTRRPCSRCAESPSASEATMPSTTSPCTPTTGRSSASSAPTAPARPPSSTSSPASSAPTRDGWSSTGSTSRTARRRPAPGSALDAPSRTRDSSPA